MSLLSLNENSLNWGWENCTWDNSGLDFNDKKPNNDLHENIISISKVYLYNLILKNLKISSYYNVNLTYDILNYLSQNSRKYFHTVINHFDEENNKILRLYDWNFNGNHIYIIAIDNYDISWLKNRRSFYSNIKRTNCDENTNSLTKTGYSILKKNCLDDFVSKFNNLLFYDDFNLAKTDILKYSKNIIFQKKKRFINSNFKIKIRE